MQSSIGFMAKTPQQQTNEANGVAGDSEPISSIKTTKKSRKLFLAVSRLAGMTSVHHFITKFLDPKLEELAEMGIISHDEIAETLATPVRKRK